MNDFLRKQLQKKVDKFFQGKSNEIVVSATEWLIYGGVVTGKPIGMSEADFEYLHKEVIGETVLVNLMSDMRNKEKLFRSLSMTEQDYLKELSQMFHYECFHRLSNSCLSATKVVAEKKVKVSKDVQVFTFKKGIHTLDAVYDATRTLNAVTRKPDTEADMKKYGLNKNDLGDMSDYEIFEKNVTITVEIGK